ncbi:DUF2637 domain-containing protein [Streptomyces prunicolor]|uniref:DUF2637 domain-containing protein n=1 Tax=Streptomyces prunicolor TaxID=67348 RepID=UPI00343961AF
MTIAAMPYDTVAADAAPVTSGAVPQTRTRVPATPHAIPETRTNTFVKGLTRPQRITAGVVVAGALALAGIGLYLSFEHVAAFAFERLHFQTIGMARLFTGGVDVGILVLIAIDLLMAWINRPMRQIRYPVWLLTGATIVLNAASAAPNAGAWGLIDYLAVFAHGIVPILFIVIVEVGRNAIERAVHPEERPGGTGVPLARWFLSPLPTFFLWRRMKLWAIETYDQTVILERDLKIYRASLKRRFVSVRKAPAEARLPLAMARYGMTIDEALALPQQEKEQERALAQRVKDDEAAETDREADRATQAEIAALKRQGAVQAARHEVTSTTGQAETRARAELVSAERAATAETEAIESAAVAEANARRAAAARKAAEDRERAAGIELDVAGTEEAAAGTRARAAEMALREEAAKAETVRARQATAEAEVAIAEATTRAAGMRLQAAEAERRAVEIEDELSLSKRDRTGRRIVRLAFTEADGNPESLSLAYLVDTFNVSTTTAGEYRKAAVEAYEGGYRP